MSVLGMVDTRTILGNAPRPAVQGAPRLFNRNSQSVRSVNKYPCALTWPPIECVGMRAQAIPLIVTVARFSEPVDFGNQPKVVLRPLGQRCGKGERPKCATPRAFDRWLGSWGWIPARRSPALGKPVKQAVGTLTGVASRRRNTALGTY